MPCLAILENVSAYSLRWKHKNKQIKTCTPTISKTGARGFLKVTAHRQAAGEGQRHKDCVHKPQPLKRRGAEAEINLAKVLCSSYQPVYNALPLDQSRLTSG